MKKIAAILSALLISASSQAKDFTPPIYDNGQINIPCPETCKKNEFFDLLISFSINNKIEINPDIIFNFYENKSLVESLSLNDYIISYKPELLYLFDNYSVLDSTGIIFETAIPGGGNTGTTEIWDILEDETAKELKYTPTIYKATQQHVDDDNFYRSFTSGAISFHVVGRVAATVGKIVKHWHSYYETVVSALVGSYVGTNIGSLSSSGLKVGDIVVSINGKVGVFRNGAFVRTASNRNFLVDLRKSSLYSSTLKFVRTEADKSKNISGSEEGSFTTVTSDGQEPIEGSGNEVVCKTVYTGSNGNNVPQPVCWIE